MKKIGSYLARRQREIKVKGKSITVYELSFIPSGADFPAVLKVTSEIYGLLSTFSISEQFELFITEAPPFGEMFGIEIKRL